MLLILTIAILIAISIHEFSHAYIADRLGDPNPRSMGRLTLNPLAHLDLLGTILLFTIGFGWGKPVQIDPFNLRSPRKDYALISLAGPVSNLLLAFLLSLIIKLVPSTFFQPIFVILIIINVRLAIFNLFPVSPLDGFSVVRGFLPKNLAYQWEELESYGFIFLLLMLFPFAGGSLLINFLDPIISTVLGLLLPGLGRIV